MQIIELKIKEIPSKLHFSEVNYLINYYPNLKLIKNIKFNK